MIPSHMAERSSADSAHQENRALRTEITRYLTDLAVSTEDIDRPHRENRACAIPTRLFLSSCHSSDVLCLYGRQL